MPGGPIPLPGILAKSPKYTDDQFAEVVKGSLSISDVLRKLGMSITGGNFTVAKLRIKRLNLDTSHMLGQSHMKGKTRYFPHGKP